MLHPRRLHLIPAVAAIVVVLTACAPPAPPNPPGPPDPPPSPTPTAEAGGWAIHSTRELPDVTGTYEAINCESPYGPWHIVIGTSATFTAFDAYFDVTLDPTTGKGPLTGVEHTAWPDGLKTDGTYAGTGTIAVTDDPDAARSLTLEYDQTIHWQDPHGLPGQQDYTNTSHVVRDVEVIPATDEEC